MITTHARRVIWLVCGSLLAICLAGIATGIWKLQSAPAQTSTVTEEPERVVTLPDVPPVIRLMVEPDPTVDLVHNCFCIGGPCNGLIAGGISNGFEQINYECQNGLLAETDRFEINVKR